MSRRSDADALLSDLLHRGAVPVMSGGRLRLDAPAGVLDACLRERLADLLPEVRDAVESVWRPREECWALQPCRRMSVCRQMERDPASLRVAGMIACGLPAVCALCRCPLPEGHRYLCRRCGEIRARSVTPRGHVP